MNKRLFIRQLLPKCMFDVYSNYTIRPKYRRHQNILIEKRKAIYFYIPKVACSSIKKIISDDLDIEIKGISEEQNVHEIDFPYIKKKDLKQYGDYYKFAFVRNPWDRILSCYFNKIKERSDCDNDFFVKGVSIGLSEFDAFYAGMSFEDFVNAISEIPDKSADLHFLSQYQFLTDANSQLIPNFVGRFENLTHDFDLIAQKIQLKNIVLPQLMKSERGHYREYYSQKSKKKISERYQKDIELFEYEY